VINLTAGNLSDRPYALEWSNDSYSRGGNNYYNIVLNNEASKNVLGYNSYAQHNVIDDAVRTSVLMTMPSLMDDYGWYSQLFDIGSSVKSKFGSIVAIAGASESWYKYGSKQGSLSDVIVTSFLSGVNVASGACGPWGYLMSAGASGAQMVWDYKNLCMDFSKLAKENGYPFRSPNHSK
jgi:hypothetical protein